MAINGFETALGAGLGAALGGLPGLFIGGLGSSLIGALFDDSSSKMKENYHYSRKLMAYQADLNQELVDAQNLYNLPQNQVERLTNAKLNPNLAYGGSGQVAGNSTNASAGLASMTQRNPAYMLQFQGEMMRLARENALLASQKSNIDADTHAKELDNIYNQQTLETRVALQTELYDKARSMAEIARNDKAMSDYKREAAADRANVEQLLLHGDDVQLWNPHGWDNYWFENSDAYVADLSESHLYEAIRAAQRSAGLSDDVMWTKYKILDKELTEYLPLKIQHIGLENAILDTKKRLWENGINPNDPVWLRLLVVCLSKWLGVSMDDLSGIGTPW